MNSFLERTVVVGPFQCNCRILVCRNSAEALIIDPGAEPDSILDELGRVGQELGRPLHVRALIHTHAHLDHIGATREVYGSLAAEGPKSESRVPRISLHRGDHDLYRALRMQGSMFGIDYPDPVEITEFLEHEQTIELGSLRFEVIHTPGHSPGGVCFRLHEDSGAGTKETVYTGDTLFHRSIGRTDLWGADAQQLTRSIKQRLFNLDDDTRVCPGHGEDSRIGEERMENPFVGEKA